MNGLDPHICARCAAQGKTCCELSGGDEEFCFPLADAERAAILEAGFAADSMVLAPNTEAFVEQLAHLMPDLDIEAAFPRPGSHWRLATTAQGRCVFLGQAGCRLDRAIRPIYCRMFPLWPYQGQLTWFTAEECLAAAECATTLAMTKAMGVNAIEIRKLFKAMCAALGLNAR